MLLQCDVMALSSFFDSIATVLTGIARRHGMEARLFEHRLHQKWPEIVGEPIASHTRPDAIRFKKLYLIAESSVWLQHLTFLKPALLEKINAAAGSPVVTDMVLRVGTIEEGVRAAEEHAHEHEVAVAQPSPQSLAEAEAHAAAVTDPELRARLVEVMAHALTRRSQK